MRCQSRQVPFFYFFIHGSLFTTLLFRVGLSIHPWRFDTRTSDLQSTLPCQQHRSSNNIYVSFEIYLSLKIIRQVLSKFYLISGKEVRIENPICKRIRIFVMDRVNTWIVMTRNKDKKNRTMRGKCL